MLLFHVKTKQFIVLQPFHIQVRFLVSFSSQQMSLPSSKDSYTKWIKALEEKVDSIMDDDKFLSEQDNDAAHHQQKLRAKPTSSDQFIHYIECHMVGSRD